MSRPADTTIHSLEEIMRVLANMRPGDRDDIMQAGSHLEEAIEFFKGNSTLVNDLINLAYKALIHMYEKDEFFFSIRAATLQAVNTIREFAVNKGDVAVEVFEKAYSELEKALKGGAESLMEQDVGVEQADTAGAPEQEVEAGSHPQDDTEVAPEQEAEAGSHPQDDTEAAPEQEAEAGSHPQDDTEVAPEQETASVGTSEVSGDEDSPEEVSLPVITLDDLASVIMQLTDDNINKSRLAQLDTIVNHLALHTAPNIAAIMQQLSEKLSGYEGASPDDANDLITFLSGKVEEAVALEMESEITTAQDGSAANHTPDAADLPAPDATANQPGSDATASNAGDFPVPDDLDTDLLQDFVSECNEQIETAESALLDLEAAPDDAELINTVFRSFHTIKGTSAFMGLTPMSEFAHAVETLLDMVRDGHHNYDSACADITLTSIDIIKSLLEKSEVLQGGDVLTMPDDYAWLMDVLLRIAEFGKNPEEALAEVQGRQAAGTGKTEG